MDSIVNKLCTAGFLLFSCILGLQFIFSKDDSLVYRLYKTISNEEDSQLKSGFEYDFVTCGSVVKLLNVRNNVRLHSHDVKYGSGSGQQSVTGVTSSDDHNSYWQVNAKTGAACVRGTPMRCGDIIRLQHLSTNKNLHSHHFQSPLSQNLEVSAFGESGSGDEGDNWIVMCSQNQWNRNDKIRLRHVSTDHYLHMTGDTFGRPIHGQREVCGFSTPMADGNYWKVLEGIYVKPTEVSQQSYSDDHDDHDEHDEL